MGKSTVVRVPNADLARLERKCRALVRDHGDLMDYRPLTASELVRLAFRRCFEMLDLVPQLREMAEVEQVAEVLARQRLDELLAGLDEMLPGICFERAGLHVRAVVADPAALVKGLGFHLVAEPGREPEGREIVLN